MMSSTIPPAVLIVGAGPTGLILAATLAMNGVSVRVVERDSAPRRGSKGSGIMPRSLEVYRFLGLLDAIYAEARPSPLARLYKPGSAGEVIKEWFFGDRYDPTPDCPYLSPLTLGQESMERIMCEHLAARYGIEVELGTEVVGFDQNADSVTARLRKTTLAQSPPAEETLVVQYLVGSDGGHSFVRHHLGLTFPGKSTEETLIYGDVALKGLDNEHWHMWGTGQAMGLLIRAPSVTHSDSFSIIMTGRQIPNPEAIAKDTQAAERLIRQITGMEQLEFDRWDYLVSHKPQVRMAEVFSRGRVFIAGDAAHAHSPTGGQGLNSSIQDTFNLGWKLALVVKGFASAELLSTYTEERAPVITEMLRRTTAILDATTRSVGTTGNVSGPSGATPGQDADASAWTRGRDLFMLGINYQWSSIVLDDQRARPTREEGAARAYGADAVPEGLRAGDRAPDAPGLRVLAGTWLGPGNTPALFDTFRPNHHTVLFFAGAAATAAPDLLEPMLAVVHRQPADTVRTALVLGSEKVHATTSPMDVALFDAQGYAFKHYDISRDASTLTAVVVRPDGVIGAIVRSEVALEQYFKLIFRLA